MLDCELWRILWILFHLLEIYHCLDNKSAWYQQIRMTLLCQHGKAPWWASSHVLLAGFLYWDLHSFKIRCMLAFCSYDWHGGLPAQIHDVVYLCVSLPQVSMTCCLLISCLPINLPWSQVVFHNFLHRIHVGFSTELISCWKVEYFPNYDTDSWSINGIVL